MKYASTLLFIVLLLFGCGDSETTQDISLNFSLTYDGEPLVMTQDYTYPDGKLIRFNRVSFFLSDIELEADGKTIPLSEVQMVNLTRSHLDEASAREGLTIDLGEVEATNVTGMSFDLGLQDSQNAQSPDAYPTDSPLANSAEYWVGWQSYIYYKIEGFVDMDGDNEPEETVALHIGSNPVRREIVVDELGGSGQVQMVIDLKDVFDNNGIFDLEASPRIHHLGQLEQAGVIADNLANALRVAR
ncbi:MAG: MbnP family protein [Bacteroidota bacterium]